MSTKHSVPNEVPQARALFAAREAALTTKHSSLNEPQQGLGELSDSELLDQLSALVKQERGVTVAVLLHLAEVEGRELHLAKGSPSLFAYCVRRLGFSEDVAYKRVGAARYARRFPIVLNLLTQGELHLSALMLIGPHLTDANHQEWLMAAAGKTKREVELLVATRCPKPDAPSSVRKLPRREAQDRARCKDDAAACSEEPKQVRPHDGFARDASHDASGCVDARVTTGDASHDASGCVDARVTTGDASHDASGVAREAAQGIGAATRTTERPRVQPLSGSTFRVVFTANEALKQKLDRAGELCSHCVAEGDLPALFERALSLL